MGRSVRCLCAKNRVQPKYVIPKDHKSRCVKPKTLINPQECREESTVDGVVRILLILSWTSIWVLVRSTKKYEKTVLLPLLAHERT